MAVVVLDRPASKKCKLELFIMQASFLFDQVIWQLRYPIDPHPTPCAKELCGICEVPSLKEDWEAEKKANEFSLTARGPSASNGHERDLSESVWMQHLTDFTVVFSHKRFL